MADLRAQIAANEKGVQELRKMVAQFGLDTVAGLHAPCAGQRRRIGAPRDHGAEGWCLHPAAGQRRADPAWRSRVDAGRSAKIDFTGTSAQQPNNFNAPKAV
jgi:5-oxoprolinase (ATP-hydrolysing)